MRVFQMDDSQHVHIVDDDDAVRQALLLLMKSENIPAKAYASAEEFLEQGAEKEPGCLLLDVRMPGMNGLQLLELLKEKHISIPVIFITGHGDVVMAVQAMKLGASDFIEKPFDNESLLRRVRNCLQECITLNCTQELEHEMERKISSLTKREREVMELLVAGKQNKVIARDLGISPRTVELHRAKVMEKLQVRSLSEIVRIALFSSEYS